MDQEAEVQVGIWQKIFQAQFLWVAEIESRLKVTIPLGTNRALVSIDDALGEGNTVQADLETGEILDSVELLYDNICSLHGDPCMLGQQYRQSADLWSREPLQAILDIGLHFIDVVLIGPLNSAATLLASEPRLMAAARTRELYAPADDGWSKRVREILARADSIIAKNAIEGVLGAA